VRFKENAVNTHRGCGTSKWLYQCSIAAGSVAMARRLLHGVCGIKNYRDSKRSHRQQPGEIID
jgi:hypothetical protein